MGKLNSPAKLLWSQLLMGLPTGRLHIEFNVTVGRDGCKLPSLLRDPSLFQVLF